MTKATPAITFVDLEMAFDFASAGQDYGNRAFIDRETGTIYYASDDLEEEVPDDLEESDRYLQIPDKRELDLGQELVLAFAKQVIPGEYGTIADFFRRRGAYSRFKDFLDRRNLLERWYEFEEQETEKALREWCRDNGVTLLD